MLTSTGPLLPLCRSMIVSVRWPTSPPVASSFSCSGVRPARLSEPTISQFVPEPEPALSAGRASTRFSEVSTHTPNPTTSSSSTSSTVRKRRLQRRGRRGRRAAGGAGGRRGGTAGGRSGTRVAGGTGAGITAVGCGRRGGGGAGPRRRGRVGPADQAGGGGAGGRCC